MSHDYCCPACGRAYPPTDTAQRFALLQSGGAAGSTYQQRGEALELAGQTVTMLARQYALLQMLKRARTQLLRYSPVDPMAEEITNAIGPDTGEGAGL